MFRRLFRKRRACAQHCGCNGARQANCCARPLSDFAQDARVTVLSNRDKKTLEMGLFSGAHVAVLKNRPRDANMVVAVGESRYIIAKESAEKVMVR